MKAADYLTMHKKGASRVGAPVTLSDSEHALCVLIDKQAVAIDELRKRLHRLETKGECA